MYRCWLVLFFFTALSLTYHLFETVQVFAATTGNEGVNRLSITVAVVDTGIDYSHATFKGIISKGFDLIQYDSIAQDDHGHGTSVAGTIVRTYESYSNKLKTVLPLRVMPVKALSNLGQGTEIKLAEGIRYAIEQEADIIVLSVGLYADDKQLRDAIEAAEENGILVVAASGNDGELVKYPAAYPSVLAVGGIQEDKLASPESNYGSEIDLLAPWKVYTSALNNKYTWSEGTSMAAPQVTAAAALYMNLNPTASPLHIRQFLRQTASDVMYPGWDRYSGYGELRIDRVFSDPAQSDMYEDNNKRQKSRLLPLNTMILAQLDGNIDRDWYRIHTEHRGIVLFELSTQVKTVPSIQLNVYSNDTSEPRKFVLPLDKPLSVEFEQGTHYIEMTLLGKDKKAYTYALTNTFKIYQDDFEGNDKQFKAFALPLRTQTITATVDTDKDTDWYVLHVDQYGTLNLFAKPNQIRHDLVIRYQANHEPLQNINETGYGENEQVTKLKLKPGKVFFSISNADPVAVHDEYQVFIEFEPDEALEQSESGGIASQSTRLRMLTPFFGQLNPINKSDIYSLSVSADHLFELTLRDTELQSNLKLQLLDQKGKILAWNQTKFDGSNYLFNRPLKKGAYFLKLQLEEKVQKLKYHIIASVDPLVSGYRDIVNHWAQPAIVNLTKKKIMNGYENFDFAPDQSITRAEATVVLVRAFKLNRAEKISFKDVKKSHWAYDEISKAVEARIVEGYGNSTFRPDQKVTRSEMAVMMANALKFERTFVIRKPFSDVSLFNGATTFITQLKNKGLLTGYRDGKFYPDLPATRAQFASLLQSAMNQM